MVKVIEAISNMLIALCVAGTVVAIVFAVAYNGYNWEQNDFALRKLCIEHNGTFQQGTGTCSIQNIIQQK